MKKIFTALLLTMSISVFAQSKANPIEDFVSFTDDLILEFGGENAEKLEFLKKAESSKDWEAKLNRVLELGKENNYDCRFGLNVLKNIFTLPVAKTITLSPSCKHTTGAQIGVKLKVKVLDNGLLIKKSSITIKNLEVSI